jgi:quercetin dioxygenase-like cupin family protein
MSCLPPFDYAKGLASFAAFRRAPRGAREPVGSSAVHRHNGQVFVYMLEGSMIMQVRGQPLVTLLPGQTFYETPGDIHVVSKNASATQPAKFLAVMIMDKGAPSTVPVK